MEPAVAKRLIEKGVNSRVEKAVYADLGAGRGVFTLALAEILGPGGKVFAVDRDVKGIGKIKGSTSLAEIVPVEKNFETEELDLGELDGILMANSLHFVADKVKLIDRLRKVTKRIILVEYNMDRGNQYVPYPISFTSLEKLVTENDLGTTEWLDEEPSVYQRAGMYSALIKLKL